MNLKAPVYVAIQPENPSKSFVSGVIPEYPGVIGERTVKRRCRGAKTWFTSEEKRESSKGRAIPIRVALDSSAQWNFFDKVK